MTEETQKRMTISEVASLFNATTNEVKDAVDRSRFTNNKTLLSTAEMETLQEEYASSEEDALSDPDVATAFSEADTPEAIVEEVSEAAEEFNDDVAVEPVIEE